MDEPKIKCSTDAEWRRYYEEQCAKFRRIVADRDRRIKELEVERDDLAHQVKNLNAMMDKGEKDKGAAITYAEDLSRAGENEVGPLRVLRYYMHQTQDSPCSRTGSPGM